MSGVGRTLAALLFPVALSAQTTLSSGAVASPDHYGAVVAQEILAAGGNAVDAAVAVGFALAVTYPEAGNIGGGGFMTLLIEGKPYFLDFREVAPAAATATMFLDDKGEVIDELSLVGNLAAGVPGTVKGLAEVHHRFGKLSWRRDLAPAIKLARQGFKVEQELIEIRDESSDPFRKAPNFDPHFGKMQAGQLFRQPELAQTLERIAKGGEAEFYRGKTAELILAQMARGPRKGIISRSDLAGYQVKWRAPLQADWRGMQVITAPPPSSGGIALLQMLTMKQDAAALFSDVALNSPKYIHLIAEIEKRVFADRAEYLGDPDFVSVPTAQLLDPAYLSRRAAEISVDRPSQLKAVRAGLEKPQTTHYSIVDRWGNAVATTYTLNGWFGSGVVVEGAGFLLNDEMDDFSAKPGAPNLYGVVGADANQIRPFAHPLSSMTPTILAKDGKPMMVLGTPGGSRIFTSIFQVLVDVFDFGLDLPSALAKLRFHHQLLPDNVIFTEPYGPFDPALTAALTAYGYKVEAQDYNGDIEAIQVIDSKPLPASDPRYRGQSLLVQ